MPEQAGVPVTLADVAAEAGVSLATASRAFNGSSTRTVREELKKRVMAAAAKLDYQANGPAQAMARGRTDVVGLIVHDVSDPYFAAIAAGVIDSSGRYGVLVTLASTGRDPQRELDHLVSLRGQRCRAVILAGSRFNDVTLQARLAEEVLRFEATGGRVAALGQAALPVDTMVVDNAEGARGLAAALVARGYRRFGVLSGPAGLLTAHDRVEGFVTGLRSQGLEPVVLQPGAFTRDGGYEAMAALLGSGAQVDCVFAVNDVMAVGAMTCCRERGLRLPEDLGLAGFDDIATLRDVHPGLTTVRLPLTQMGAEAMDMVAESRSHRPQRRRVDAEVVLRESTPPRG